MAKMYHYVFTAILCCIVLSSCVCINCGCRSDTFTAERQVSLDQPMQQGQTLSVQTHHGYIHVTGTDEDHCYITATLRAQAESIEKANEIAEMTTIRFDNSQDKTAVVIDKPVQFQDYGVYVSYEIRLPQKTSVTLGTTHGEIVCSNLRGTVTASTTHDSIRCSDINGDQNLNTTHGAIKLTDITGPVTARTTHNTIEAERITGNSEFNTTHGRVVCRDMNSPTLRVLTSHNNVDISFTPDVESEIKTDITTSHGNIVFHVPPSFGGRVSLSTTHGKMKTDIPLLVMGETSEDNLQGTIGDGNGNINLTTTHGSITLKKQQ